MRAMLAALAVLFSLAVFAADAGGLLSLTLDKAVDGDKAATVYLSRREGKMAQGWLANAPLAVLPYALDVSGLALTDTALTGKLSVTIPADRGIADEKPVTLSYVLDAKLAGGILTGTFTATHLLGAEPYESTEKALTGAVSGTRQAWPAKDGKLGAGYPCWRGPNGSGAADSGAKLIDDISKAKKLWTSEWIPGVYGSLIQTGNAGCVVGDGKVILIYHDPHDAVYDEASAKKMAESWSGNRFGNLGYGELGAKAAKGDKDAQLAYAKKKFSVAADDVILCLDAETGKTLWSTRFLEHGLNNSKQVRGAFICAKSSPHCIACVADGKVYAYGSTGRVYCLDLATGQPAWQGDLGGVFTKFEAVKLKARQTKTLPEYPGRMSLATGPVYAAGTLVAYDDGGALIGFNPDTGKQRWTARPKAGGLSAFTGAPVRWVSGDKEYVIAQGTCIDPTNGKVLWEAGNGPAGEMGVSCVSGTSLIAGSAISTITPEAATRAYEVKLDCGDGKLNCFRTGTPVVVGGHAFFRVCNGSQGYGPNDAKLYMLDLATGKVEATINNTAATGKAIGLGTENSSWVGGDGRAFLECGRDGGSAILMLVADPANCKASALAVGGYGMSTTPVYCEGKLYLRMQTGIVCYDLRAE